MVAGRVVFSLQLVFPSALVLPLASLVCPELAGQV